MAAASAAATPAAGPSTSSNKPAAAAADASLYEEHEKLQEAIRQVDLQMMVCKMETHQLKKEEHAAKREVKRIQSVPLVLGQFVEAIDQERGIVGSTSGAQHYVRILSTLDREKLKPNASIGLHRPSKPRCKPADFEGGAKRLGNSSEERARSSTRTSPM